MYYELKLYHHGIRGQKWGKQNGPPYPLSRKEKRKQKKQEKKVARTIVAGGVATALVGDYVSSKVFPVVFKKGKNFVSKISEIHTKNLLSKNT